MEHKEWIVLCSALALCSIIFISSYLLSTSHRTIYTIEVYEIFDITHTTRRRDGIEFTNVYTYGKGQFYFRGNYDWNISKSYVFTYKETGKRWRDLELIEWREIKVLKRNEDCGGCPD
jgi:hypothetical protein